MARLDGEMEGLVGGLVGGVATNSLQLRELVKEGVEVLDLLGGG